MAAPSSYCEVDFLDHFTISPDGGVYLCTHTFDPAEAVGSLRPGSQPLLPDSAAVYAKWYALGPFEDQECVNCQLLPVCFGGCRKSRLQGFRECIEEKASLDLFVRSIVEDRIQTIGSPSFVAVVQPCCIAECEIRLWRRGRFEPPLEVLAPKTVLANG